jgi:hypothetical protein
VNDLIGELLRANLLQQVGDDEIRVGRLRAASRAAAEGFAALPSRLPSALLSAVDGNGADSPMLRWAHDVLLNEWETLENAFADRPVELFRAVLLDASASAFTRDPNVLAAGWYTLRSAMEQAPIGRWEPVLRRLLQEWDDDAGARAEQAWLLLEPQPIASAEPEVAPQNEETTPEAESEGEPEAAAEAETPETPEAGLSPARKRAAQIAELAAGYAGNAAQQLAQQITELVDELIVESVRAAERATATVSAQLRTMSLKTELLWWQAAGHSVRRRCRYSELSPARAAIAAALDLHHLVDPLSPVSVEHILHDTVADAVDDTVTLAALAGCDWASDLSGIGTPAGGTLLAAVLKGRPPTPLFEPDAELPAARAAVLLFRDLQAARLLGIERP